MRHLPWIAIKLFYVCEACEERSNKQGRKACEINIPAFKVVNKTETASCVRMGEKNHKTSTAGPSYSVQ